MCLAICLKGFRLQLVKWPQTPSPLASEITAKWFSACVMKGHKVHLHLSLLWCFDVACALSRFISRGDYIKPQISKTHTSFVCSGYREQTQKSWACFFNPRRTGGEKNSDLKQQFGEVALQIAAATAESACNTPVERLWLTSSALLKGMAVLRCTCNGIKCILQ